MIITILTLFPEMFDTVFKYSIIKRAIAQRIVEINLVNIREFAIDAYKTVDDRPFGGGAGMILKVDLIDRAIESLKSKIKPDKKVKIILLDPKGVTFSQAKAQEFSHFNRLILICGHYEGVDARIENLVDEVISIGKYVLTGGELPSMVIVDSVVRLIPGVLQNPDSLTQESFSNENLEYPQYTRPASYKGMNVPDILLSGNHKEIEKWKSSHSQKIPKTNK